MFMLILFLLENYMAFFELNNLYNYNAQRGAYKKPFIGDEFASGVEEILTIAAMVPFIGTVPALLKVAFGLLQMISSAAILLLSTLFLPFEPVQELWFHAFRHIVHGAGNVLLGAVQAIPFVGLAVGGYQKLDATSSSSACLTYYNSQSHKFFAYKTLEDTSWKKYQAGESSFRDPEEAIAQEFVPSEYKQRLLSL